MFVYREALISAIAMMYTTFTIRIAVPNNIYKVAKDVPTRQKVTNLMLIFEMLLVGMG